MCKRILGGIKTVDLNESVIIFDTSKTDELKSTIRNVAKHLKWPTVSYNHCLYAQEGDDTNEWDDESNYYVTVSK